MSRETTDKWCERGILALVLVILGFGPLAIGAVRASGFLVIQGLTLGVMLLWGARFWLNRKAQLFWPPVCWAVSAFTIYAIARYITADIEYVARQELLRVLVYAFLFLAILNNLQRKESVLVISSTLLFLAMGISFYAIYQFVTGSDRVWDLVKPYHHRGSGTYISPNHLAGFLEMLLPLGLAYTLCGRLRPVLRILIGYASLVIAMIPILVAVIETALPGGETLNLRGWMGTLLGAIGMFSLVWPSLHRAAGAAPDRRAVAGFLILVLAAVSFAVGSVLSRRFRFKVDTFAATTWQIGAASVVNLAVATLGGNFQTAHWTVGAVFGSVVGLTAYVYLLKHVPVTKVSTYAFVNPVIAVLIGVVTLGERLAPAEILGMMIILVAVATVILSRTAPAPPPTDPMLECPVEE